MENTATETTTEAVEAPEAQDNGKAPKFEGEFDAERAAKLIENLRGDIAKLKASNGELSSKLSAREDAEKTEFEKLTERLQKAEKDATEFRTALTVAKVAREHGIPEELTGFLTGANEEEIAAKAKLLADTFGQTGKSLELPGKPKAKLVPSTGGADADKPQLTREDLAGMSAAQVREARREGRLDSLLGK